MINREIKINILTLALISFLFIIYQVITVHILYDHLKNDYITIWSEITGKLIEQNPENEYEIIQALTNDTANKKDYSSDGEMLLKQYGLSAELDSRLFPYLNKHISQNNIYMFLGAIGFSLILIFLNYLQYKSFFLKIRNVTAAAHKIIEGDYTIDIKENREGDLAKLANSFHKLKNVIRKSMHNLMEEKQFLIQTLQDISHQLKTPLSTLTVNNDILLQGKLNEQQYHFLHNNDVQISRINFLIHNLLKVSKIDARAILFEKENSDIIDTIYEVIASLNSKLNKKNMNIHLKTNEKISLFHDSIWMQEALLNILKNSIEHSNDNSSIYIEVTNSPIHTEIIIQDFGEGIASEDLPYIFDRFYKTKNSNKEGSIGIGLALAKSIIEAHHGFIKVESQKHSFTKFTITFMKY
ncbi:MULTISPECIES: sensor histidine kinase [Bacillus cereus group]|uniref:sensor histidine kinase n=1 Tax=Bacillus cereus group TaxID=86661 RepID=UPI0020793906|nr:MULTISPECIES: HAMP domain-containing sensor histidine kinase [Bacillus cereus group]MDC7729776.1 HAMP domain-containing sensor histidine kinase [Bacillus cereus]MDZ4588461.1 HAMP domain-containing sensor histidine kinase [Bacillus cereus]MDZ4599537.1 HAMP domain-containing sensor histidine kinase [Bacillus cereus]USL10851.1 HAMP domain-containing histidine kinase [Bacillus bombysepticus]